MRGKLPPGQFHGPGPWNVTPGYGRAYAHDPAGAGAAYGSGE
ncbi:hypothetical protein [Microbispora rosea]